MPQKCHGVPVFILQDTKLFFTNIHRRILSLVISRSKAYRMKKLSRAFQSGFTVGWGSDVPIMLKVGVRTFEWPCLDLGSLDHHTILLQEGWVHIHSFLQNPLGLYCHSYVWSKLFGEWAFNSSGEDWRLFVLNMRREIPMRTKRVLYGPVSMNRDQSSAGTAFQSL